jgi:hypothetical protein
LLDIFTITLAPRAGRKQKKEALEPLFW